MFKTGDSPGPGKYECLTCKKNTITLSTDEDTIPKCCTEGCSGDIWARMY
ncbi:hypothetical protein RD055328_05490 [Companilactobacillus sp. RD055328]|nr:hypothetical protein RD055328_05490 [Companilactobacillus sp. RD055328]